MAVIPSRISVTEGYGKNLDSAQLRTDAGNIERSGMFIGDPETMGNRLTISPAGAAKIDGSISIEDFSVALKYALLSALNHQIASENVGGRLRVVLDAAPGAQTLGAVTTVGTVTVVTGQTNVGGIAYRDAIFVCNDRILWGQNVRARIT